MLQSVIKEWVLPEYDHDDGRYHVLEHSVKLIHEDVNETLTDWKAPSITTFKIQGLTEWYWSD